MISTAIIENSAKCRHTKQIKKKHKNCSSVLISATDKMIGVNQHISTWHKIHLSALLLEVFF